MNKKKRVELSKRLLRKVQKAREHSYVLFLTGDESWFYLETNYELVWLPSNESPPEKEKRMITDKKMMLTVFWNPEGFLVVDVLPHGQKFNSEYFINNILQPIYRSLSSRAKELGKTITLYFANARVHSSRKVQEYMHSHNMKKAAQTPYSPDIAPADFFLFGYVKDKLKGFFFKTVDELFEEITSIINKIPKELIKKVFQDWIERCQHVIDMKGNYIDN